MAKRFRLQCANCSSEEMTLKLLGEYLLCSKCVPLYRPRRTIDLLIQAQRTAKAKEETEKKAVDEYRGEYKHEQ
jgi:hypothetical protein